MLEVENIPLVRVMRCYACCYEPNASPLSPTRSRRRSDCSNAAAQLEDPSVTFLCSKVRRGENFRNREKRRRHPFCQAVIRFYGAFVVPPLGGLPRCTISPLRERGTPNMRIIRDSACAPQIVREIRVSNSLSFLLFGFESSKR